MDEFIPSQWTQEDWAEFDADPINSKIGKAVGKLYLKAEREIAARGDDDYEINREQALKLFAAYEFFESYVKMNGGRIKPIVLKPHEEVGHLTCYSVLYDFVGADIIGFCKNILGASALSINAMLDNTVCISMTFPDVFVRKHK